ncbi:MAG: hypothetical protein CBE47_03045 [Pelagibacteraceae bacterium TMED287]|nr:MAG: hypothetical protein CBE47_03045 [Pelagibacteraceae bacterium TMED287]
MMKRIKNINLGKTRNYLKFFLFLFLISINQSVVADSIGIIKLKILDKVSSKNTELEFKIGDTVNYKNLQIKVLKCKNSEFDDDPEITAYLQVIDLNKTNNDDVFVFNGWSFASSPSINPFDHPVYDLWIIECI